MPHGNHNSLGDHVRKARLKLGLSQREVCRRTHLDIGHVSRIESGQRVPTLATLQRLVEALELDESEALQLTGLGSQPLPAPRTYFRRKFGINAEEADVLAKLIEDYQAKHPKGGKSE